LKMQQEDTMTDILQQLSGVFLVTGGTRGIGRAISSRLASAGACVVANYIRNETAAQEFKALADKEQWRIELCRADLSNPKALKQIEETIERTGEPLRGLIHCAATGTHRPATDLTKMHIDLTFAVNVHAFLELVKMLLPKFAIGSSVIAVSSFGAIRAMPNYAAIGMSKAALESLVRHLALELGPRGIRANILAPGAVATEVWKAIPDSEARLAEAAKRSPIQRLVTADEVACAAHFLCSSAASGINGHTLVIDGGASILL
jgi:enoyl-[acyl-carrier protein] reductase III